MRVDPPIKPQYPVVRSDELEAVCRTGWALRQGVKVIRPILGNDGKVYYQVSFDELSNYVR